MGVLHRGHRFVFAATHNALAISSPDTSLVSSTPWDHRECYHTVSETTIKRQLTYSPVSFPLEPSDRYSYHPYFDNDNTLRKLQECNRVPVVTTSASESTYKESEAAASRTDRTRGRYCRSHRAEFLSHVIHTYIHTHIHKCFWVSGPFEDTSKTECIPCARVLSLSSAEVAEGRWRYNPQDSFMQLFKPLQS